MSEGDHRQIIRDSLFVLADLRIDGTDCEYRVKVRNLSAGGMMAEGEVKVLRGMPLEINIRNIGWIEGTVAWVQDSRFGIAFRDEIDPKVARAPFAAGSNTPVYLRPPLSGPPEQSRLRKI
jgi:hypothetical protein